MASVDAGMVLELLKLGAQVYAGHTEARRARQVAAAVDAAAEAAQRMLEARAGGPLHQLTDAQLAEVVAGLRFRSPAEVAGHAAPESGPEPDPEPTGEEGDD